MRRLLIAAVTGLMALSGGVADAQHWRRDHWDRGEHRGWDRGEHRGWDRGYYPRYRTYRYPLIRYEVGVYPYYRRYHRHGHWECWRHHHHRVCEWVRW